MENLKLQKINQPEPKIIECPVVLYKTDYDNQSDLSKFVNEYHKAQAMIKECNDFYRSFLRSKLHTYSQLTKNSHCNYRFMDIKLSEPKECKIDFIKAISDLGYGKYADVFKENPRGIYGGLVAIRIAEFMACIDLSNKYKSRKYPVELCIRHSYEYYTEIDSIMFKKSKRFFNLYCREITPKCTPKKNIEFDSIDGYKEYIKALREELGKEMHDLQKKYLPKILDYIGYDNILQVDAEYRLWWDVVSVLHAARDAETWEVGQTFNYLIDDNDKRKLRDKTINEIKRRYQDIQYGLFDKEKRHISINLIDYLDKDTIIELMSKYISNFGCYSTKIWIDDFNCLKDNKKFENFVCQQNAEYLEKCKEILHKYAKYNDDKLYIVDDKRNVQYYCNVEDLSNNKVDIQIEGRNLVCTFIDTSSKYCDFTRSSNITDIKRTIKFDIDTNDIVSFDTYTSRRTEKEHFGRGY